MILRLFVISVFLLLLWPLNAQSEADQEEIAKLEDRFSRRLAEFEGFSPTPFEAPDMDGNNHYLADHKGQILIMQFWRLPCQPCLSQMPSLHKLLDEYNDQSIAVLSFSDDYGKDLENYVSQKSIHFPVIPNSRNLGMDAFAGDLGYPRVFIIDKFGIIRKLILGGSSDDEMALYDEIKPVIESLLKE